MSSKIGVQNIAHTNGTVAATVSSGGVVAFNNTIIQPALTKFFVRLGSSYNIFQNATTTVPFASELFDVGGYFNVSNYRYTPPVGTYRLFVNISINNLSAPTDRATVRIRKYDNSASSDSVLARGDIGQGTQTEATSWGVETFDTQTDANDYYYCTIFTDAGTRQINGDSVTSRTYFGGQQI